MLIVTLINLIAVILVYISRNERYKFLFEVSIVLLICFYGIRYNYGNDYSAYLQMFNEINSYSSVTYSTDSHGIERGWLFLNRLFAPSGFFPLVFLLTILQFTSIYILIKKYVNNNNRYLALFIYLFTSGLMLTMLSMMRQCLAMSLVLLSIPFIINKKFWFSIPLIYLAAQFHQSAYMLLLLPISVLLQKLRPKTYYFSFIIIFILLFVSSNSLHNLMGYTIETYFEKYMYHFESDRNLQLGSGIGFMFSIVFFCAIVLSDKHFDTDQSWFMKMTAISYMFIPLGFITPLIGRVGTYFSVLAPIGIPNFFKYSKGKFIPSAICALYLLNLLYTYFQFFYSDIFRHDYSQFHTILGTTWK